MTIIAAPSPLPALAAMSNDSLINDTILPSVESNRALADPIELFGQDCNKCNDILSAISPSTSLQLMFTKHKASNIHKKARAVHKKTTKQPTSASST